MDEREKLKYVYIKIKVMYKEKKQLHRKGKGKLTFDLTSNTKSDSNILTGFRPGRPRKDREPTLSILGYEKVSGVKQIVSEVNDKLKQVTKYTKLEQLEVYNGKDKLWEDSQTWEDWFFKIREWTYPQELDISKPLAFRKCSAVVSEDALRYCINYRNKTEEDKWNLYPFMIILRNKLIL